MLGASKLYAIRQATDSYFKFILAKMLGEIIEKCNESALLSPYSSVNTSLSFYSNILKELSFQNNGVTFFEHVYTVHSNYIELEPRVFYYFSTFGILVSFLLLVVHLVRTEHENNHRSNISGRNLSSYIVSYILLYLFKILYYKVAFLNLYFFLYSLMVYVSAFLTLITTFDTYLLIRHSVQQFRIINFNFDNYVFFLYSLCGWGIPTMTSWYLLYMANVTIDGFVYFICLAEVILRMLSMIFLFVTFVTLKQSVLSKFSKKFYARLVVLSGSVFLMSWVESICNLAIHFVSIDIYVQCAIRYCSDISGAYEGVIIFCLFAPKHSKCCFGWICRKMCALEDLLSIVIDDQSVVFDRRNSCRYLYANGVAATEKKRIRTQKSVRSMSTIF